MNASATAVALSPSPHLEKCFDCAQCAVVLSERKGKLWSYCMACGTERKIERD